MGLVTPHGVEPTAYRDLRPVDVEYRKCGDDEIVRLRGVLTGVLLSSLLWLVFVVCVFA